MMAEAADPDVSDSGAESAPEDLPDLISSSYSEEGHSVAEPGGRSTVSVQLDGMDQAKFALPRSLLVSADSYTTREYKNQLATFMAYLVATEKFEATEVQFLQAGHTHNEQDQCFSTVASLLSRRRAPDNEYVHIIYITI